MNFIDKGTQGRGGIIVFSILKMAKWLNTSVIAEGVETEEQARFMHENGCYYIQGFFYSKPVPESKFVELLRNEKSKH